MYQKAYSFETREKKQVCSRTFYIPVYLFQRLQKISLDTSHEEIYAWLSHFGHCAAQVAIILHCLTSQILFSLYNVSLLVHDDRRICVTVIFQKQRWRYSKRKIYQQQQQKFIAGYLSLKRREKWWTTYLKSSISQEPILKSFMRDNNTKFVDNYCH